MLIRDFLVGVVTTSAQLFNVNRSTLCMVGHAKRNTTPFAKTRTRRQQIFAFSGGVGDYATVHKGPLAHFIVRVVAVIGTLNEEALASSFDTDTSWHAPDAGGQNCYRILRLGHRFRHVAPPETACESWDPSCMRYSEIWMHTRTLHALFNDFSLKWQVVTARVTREMRLSLIHI